MGDLILREEKERTKGKAVRVIFLLINMFYEGNLKEKS